MYEPYYDVAQVCLRGHLVNSGIKDTPQKSSDHCPKCGQPTITKCPRCGVEIRGQYHSPVEGYTVMSFTSSVLPRMRQAVSLDRVGFVRCSYPCRRT